jgi:hypothetical protein
MGSEKVGSSATVEHHEDPDHHDRDSTLKIDRGNEAILLRLDTEGGIDGSVKLAKDGHVSRSPNHVSSRANTMPDCARTSTK